MIVEVPVSCPHCHAPMTKGNIIGGEYYLKWMPDTEKLFLGIWAKNCIRFAEDWVYTFWSSRYSRCYVGSSFCNSCKNVIIDLTDDNISSTIPSYKNEDIVSTTSTPTPCPYCRTPMMKGKLLGGLYPLKWIPDTTRLFCGVFLGLGWSKNAIKIGNWRLLIRSSAPAYFCNICNKIITNQHVHN